MMLAWRRFYPDLLETGFLDLEQRANTATRQLAAQRGIELVDAAVFIPPGPRYFGDFVHFADAGSQKMAEKLAAQVSQAAPPAH